LREFTIGKKGGKHIDHWLNVDKPTKTCTYHQEADIPSAKYKGINELKRDGRWFKVSSEQEAKELAQKYYPEYKFIKANNK
jgi:hypothetical protein